MNFVLNLPIPRHTPHRWLLLRAGHPDHAAKRRDWGVRRAAAASDTSHPPGHDPYRPSSSPARHRDQTRAPVAGFRGLSRLLPGNSRGTQTPSDHHPHTPEPTDGRPPQRATRTPPAADPPPGDDLRESEQIRDDNKLIRDTSSSANPTTRHLTTTTKIHSPDSRHRHRKSTPMTP
ncbi:hypothetical protein Ae331Ps2_6372 [Pseudonocardia sp. Ae331_Ps2]|nr:hypothetical protein Ae331Ps2_6372 [Pseudonocardia sp. Ae331_Ps2]